MKIGNNEIKLEKRITLSGWRWRAISIMAIFFALALLSLLFILAGVNPLIAYQKIFTYAFANPFGLPLTINRSIFLLLCTFAFIIPYKAGLWNIGMTGQLYVGSLSVFAVVYAFGGKQFNNAYLSPVLLIPLMLIAAALGGRTTGWDCRIFEGQVQCQRDRHNHDVELYHFLVGLFYDQRRGSLHEIRGRGRWF